MVGLGRPRAGRAPARRRSRRCCATPWASRAAAPRPPSLEALELTPVRLPDAAVAALAAIVGPDARARRSRGPRPPRARQVDHRPARAARRRADQRARPRRQPGVARRGPGGARVLQRAAGGRHPVRGRHLGGRRPATRDGAASPGRWRSTCGGWTRCVSVDEESRLAVLEPGLRGPEAEALLGARGYTLGHFPQSWEYATLGGFAAARSSGQARRATAASTSACWRCAWPRRRGRSSWAARPSRRPARTCASSCSAPRARSA